MRGAVAARWLRRAIQRQRLEDIELRVPDEQLPFRGIFGDRKRIVVDAPGLRPDFPDEDRQEIEDRLREHGQLEEGDAVDWDRGVVRDERGREVRLGKRIARASAKFEKTHPDAWRAMRGSLKARAAYDRADAQYQMRVTAPLTDLLDAWAEEGPPGERGLTDLLKMVREATGHEETKSDKLKEIVLGQKPAKIPHIGAKAQEIWAAAMREILEAPDDIGEKMQRRRDEMERERERLTEEAKAASDRLRAGTSEDPEADRKRTRDANRARDRLLADQWRADYARVALGGWPREDRMAFARSIERSAADMGRADDGLEEAKEKYRAAADALDREGRIEMASLQRLERARQRYDRWKSKKDNVAVVISRAPIDVLRMSDHPTASQKIDSCHKPGKSHFQCAVDEAQGSGLVAYVVDKDQIKDRDPESPELFADVDRGVEGVVPEARIRLRRFERTDGSSELAVPEHAVYGAQYPDLLDFVTDWARDQQREVFEAKPRLSEYQLTGGTYRDTSDADMFNHFFDTPGREHGNAPHKKEKGDGAKAAPPRKAPDSDEFWSWLGRTHREVPNPNPAGRKRTIAPSTLREYAQGGQHQQRARQLVQRYLRQFRSGRQS